MSTVQTLTHFSTFSGIGGIDLAAEWAGFETVGQCEYADYPTKVLEKHWPDVPRWRDIRDVTAESFYERTGRRTTTLISGGFPCQPFSVAGNRRGKEDDRFLWPELLRVVSEIRPHWFIGENVPGIINMALDDVLSDLESIGYSTQAFLIPACGVDARHRRNRVFIVGNAEHDGQPSMPQLRGDEAAGNQRREKEQDASRKSERADRSANESGICGGTRGSEQQDVANTESERCREAREYIKRSETRTSSGGNVAYTNGDGQPGKPCNESTERCNSYEINSFISKGCDVADTDSKRGCGQDNRRENAEDAWKSSGCSQFGRWDAEPDVGRVANGVPSRVDRLRCLGNAVVPQQVYPLLKFIAEIEHGFYLAPDRARATR